MFPIRNNVYTRSRSEGHTEVFRAIPCHTAQLHILLGLRVRIQSSSVMIIMNMPKNVTTSLISAYNTSRPTIGPLPNPAKPPLGGFFSRGGTSISSSCYIFLLSSSVSHTTVYTNPAVTQNASCKPSPTGSPHRARALLRSMADASGCEPCAVHG